MLIKINQGLSLVDKVKLSLLYVLKIYHSLQRLQAMKTEDPSPSPPPSASTPERSKLSRSCSTQFLHRLLGLRPCGRSIIAMLVSAVSFFLATCPAHLILCDCMTSAIRGSLVSLLSSSLCLLLHCPSS